MCCHATDVCLEWAFVDRAGEWLDLMWFADTDVRLEWVLVESRV